MDKEIPLAEEILQNLIRKNAAEWVNDVLGCDCSRFDGRITRWQHMDEYGEIWFTIKFALCSGDDFAYVNVGGQVNSILGIRCSSIYDAVSDRPVWFENADVRLAAGITEPILTTY